MSATTIVTNDRPTGKQLSDHLDRLDAILEVLSEALSAAVADACREGARHAVKDAVIELLTRAPSSAPSSTRCGLEPRRLPSPHPRRGQIVDQGCGPD